LLSKEAKIGEMGELRVLEGGSRKWKLEWRKQWFEWEKYQVATLMDEMEIHPINRK